MRARPTSRLLLTLLLSSLFAVAGLAQTVAKPAPAVRPAVAPAAAPAAPAPAEKQGRATAAEAKALVETAITYVKAVGMDKAFTDFSTPGPNKWHDRDMYVYAFDFDANTLAHGAFPKMIGKNMSQLKTVDGQVLIVNMVEIIKSKGEGWIEYQWPHPETKATEHKKAFVKRIPNTNAFIGVGIYQ